MLKKYPTLSLKKFILPSLFAFSPPFSLTLSAQALSSNWKDEPDGDLLSTTDLSVTDWSLLISADTFLIACVLGWVLYTYCFPHKVWGLWQKVFAFSSFSEEAIDEKR